MQGAMLLMLAATACEVRPAVADGDDPGPGPREDAHGGSGGVPPWCARTGCRGFARWQPVVMLGGYDWQGHVPCELSLGVCDDHRGSLADYADAEGWRVLGEALVARAAGQRTRVRAPARHLSTVEHVPLPPRWVPLAVRGPVPGDPGQDVVELHQPSDWCKRVAQAMQASGLGAREAVAVLLAGLAMLPRDGDARPVFAAGGTGPTLGECAWRAGVDLEGIALVADAGLRLRQRGGQ